MRERRRIVVSVLAASAVLVILLGVRPLPAERLLAGYVLALAAIALAALTRIAQPAAERRAASPFEQALRQRHERPVRPPELIRTERELTLGMSNAGHAYSRLLPLLREAAAARLAARHGIDLRARPRDAEELLGGDAWELLRPDLAAPEDRNAAGLPIARVEALVGVIEDL
jgi:hypothetical protein